MEISNADIAGLQHRIVIFRNELDKSVSSTIAAFREPDRIRLRSYIAALDSYKEWVMSQDPIDAPHWHVRAIQLKELPPPVETENASLLDVVRMLELMSVELTNSQSKDLPAGMTVHDSTRFDQNLNRLSAFLEEYLESETQPLDLPEAASDESKGRK